MSDDRAAGGARSGGRHARQPTGPRARHHGNGPDTADAPRPPRAVPTKTRPPNPLASKPPRRDSLTPSAATSGIWFTRVTVALVTDFAGGLGFVLGAPTNSSTYHFMELVAPMWVWGAALMAIAPMLVFGAIVVGAPLGGAIWLWFAYSNLVPLLTGDTGAWGVHLFATFAILHFGMWWYILRGRLPRLHLVRPTR